jgi:hypothetical protein
MHIQYRNNFIIVSFEVLLGFIIQGHGTRNGCHAENVESGDDLTKKKICATERCSAWMNPSNLDRCQRNAIWLIQVKNRVQAGAD